MPDGIAGEPDVAEWRPYGAALLSYEDMASPSGGFLGVDYTQNVDTRWRPQVMLGPAINTVDCGSAGGTAADSSGMALAGPMNATLYAYVIRGTKWAKIQASNMSLISDGSETALAEAATSIIYARNADGSATGQIAIGMDNTAYRIITTVSGGVTDTHSAHASVINRIMGHAAESGAVARVIGMGRSGAAGTGSITVRSLELTSATTMSGGTWSTIDTIGPADVTFTGFAMDDDFMIVGTDRGPVYVDGVFSRFRFMFPEIGQDSNNCKQMTFIPWMGVVCPMATSTMLIKGLQVKTSIGPERFPTNTSPITGRCTGVADAGRYAYMAIYNPIVDDTYICAVRPAEAEDRHDQDYSYFPVAHFIDTSANFLRDIGTGGGVRTSPTMMGGYNDDVFWFTRGTVDREPDDSNYRFATSGTLYLTEMRRQPDWEKEVEYIEFETASCSSTETLTVKLSIDGATAEQVGVPVTTNGYQRINAPRGMFRGTRIKPQVVFASGANTTSPKLEGYLRIHYRRYEKYVDSAGRMRH